MNYREKIAALAEEAGWTNIYFGPDPLARPTGVRPGAQSVFAGHWGVSNEPVMLPDYGSDLNAMREIELWMRDTGRWSGYVGILKKVCGGGVAKAISASASQRFHAALEHLGIQEDSFV